MPTVSLRLAEEELAALKSWAHDSRRSLQKEIVWRLFADKGVLNVVREHVVKEVEQREGATITGERPTASGGTDVTASADSVQIRRERSREPTKSGAPLSPDDDALRPPRSSCPMQPPRGTKCKVCGKVHPL